MSGIEKDILFEKFELKACLKKDSFSAVYLARHLFLDKDILLKALNTRNLPDPSLLVRFKREAKILARLDHPHIIKVLDFGNYQDFFYISFEYFESHNLRFWLQKKTWNNSQKKQLVAQLIDALCFAHDQGVIHRDLKPENILINEQLHLKIADFGLALVKDESRITEEQSLVGTPAYMSPEQIRGEALTIQTDQFNLGIILFEWFSGKNPFLGQDAGQTINNILNVSISDLQREMGAIPPEFRAPILRLLQKSPQKRFSNTRELRSAFLQTASRQKARGASGIPLKRGMALLSALAVVLLLFLLLLWRAQSGLKKPKISTLPARDTVRVGRVARKETTPLKASTPKNQLSDLSFAPKQEPEKPDNLPATAQAASETVVRREPARLILECFPWAEVEIDSQYHFTTPLSQSLLLEPGEHFFAIKHPAYPLYQGKIVLQAAEEKKLQLKLDTLFAYLNCQVHPWGEIYLDGQAIGQSPLKHPLAVTPGRHVLTIKHEQIAEFCDTLSFVRKDTLTVKINLLQNAHVVNH